jgi:putative tricarboxylic transport membrane protein
MNKDLLSGLVLLVIAGAYYWAAGLIADSTLSDEVGAAGLPRALTYALAGLAVLLIVRSLAVARTAPAPRTDEEAQQDGRASRALGLLLFGAAYVLLIPWLGYVVSVALLIAGIAVYEGARRNWVLPAVAVGGAALFWAIFVKLLGVNQPAGSLWQGLF